MKVIYILSALLLLSVVKGYGQCNMYDAWVHQQDCLVDPQYGDGPNGFVVYGKVDNPGAMGFEVLTPFGTFGPFDYIEFWLFPYVEFQFAMLVEEEHCADTFTVTVRDVEFPSCSVDLWYEPEYCCCNIVDLQVDTVCIGPGEFQLVIDFEITGGDPMNSIFYIKLQDDQGNNVYSNHHELAALPVTIGPFNADCVTPLKVIIEKGGGLDHCLAEWELGALCCGANICSIDNLIAEPTPCDGMEEYEILLDFTIDNPGSQGFQVYMDYCQCTEYYDYADLPVLLGPFPGDCMTDINLEVSDVEYGCIEGISVEAPCCAANMNCAIDSMTLDTICLGQDSFLIVVDFQVANGSPDGFILYVNNSMDTMDYAVLPLELGPFPADCSTYYLVYVEDMADPTCAAELDIQAPCCEPPTACVISDLTLNVVCLEEDSMTVLVDFEVVQGSSDSFEMWINDSLYAILYYADLPYETPPLYVDCSMDYHFLVQDAAYPDCYAEGVLEEPCCQGNKPAFSNFSLDTICHGLGMFSLTVGFDVLYPGEEGWQLQVDTVQVGPFDYQDIPHTVGPFSMDCDTLITVLLFDKKYPESQELLILEEVCCLLSSTAPIDRGEVRYSLQADRSLYIENATSAALHWSLNTILGQSLTGITRLDPGQSQTWPLPALATGMLILSIQRDSGLEVHRLFMP
jgi:hypothetical protein